MRLLLHTFRAAWQPFQKEMGILVKVRQSNLVVTSSLAHSHGEDSEGLSLGAALIRFLPIIHPVFLLSKPY